MTSRQVVHRQLLIGSLPPPVGGTTVLLAQLVGLLRDRPDVVLDICDTSRRDGKAGRFASMAKALWACIGRGRSADSVAYHGSLAGVLGAAPLLVLVCLVLRRRVLVRIFGGNLSNALNSWPQLFTFGFRHVVLPWSIVLCETKEGTAALRRLGGRRVVWYPNSRPMGPVDPPRSLSPGTPFRLVYVGHVRPEKGVRELVDAVRQLGREVELDIYGPVFGGISAEELASAHSVYRGPVDPAAVPELLRRYDALALPSYYPGEGYPGVILEAYAAGLPVISTNWQCIPEIVTEESGILVPPRDVDALVNAIRKMSTGDLYQQFRAGARAKASSFDAVRWADVYVELSNDSG